VFDIAVRHVLTSDRPFEVVLDGIHGGISQPDIGALFAGLALGLPIRSTGGHPTRAVPVRGAAMCGGCAG
jgi:hypothetical protein